MSVFRLADDEATFVFRRYEETARVAVRRQKYLIAARRVDGVRECRVETNGAFAGL